MSGVGAVTRGRLMLPTSAQALPFGRDLVIRSYLIATDAGNALIYSSELGAGDEEAIADRGTPVARYLNHWHEAIFEPESSLVERVPLIVGAGDRAETEERMPVSGTIDERTFLAPDLEAIPIPGHTPGATAYLWESDGVRRLFTGDSVTVGDDGWVAAVFGDSDPASYAESLEVMAGLEFDVLVPWAVKRAASPVVRATREEGRRRMLEIAERVRRGTTR